ncbi:MAG TPA: hypothetical protein PLS77_11995 [Anaerolineaceae bacterium]|nr:hypothetical protein [Anaerolineaceae bacterium]HQF46540.1 hypothetical protein [Anaerolineaceae bacterium]HQH36417.1 hypothetical protein [Anaerolineaceae bacterium]HQO98603.1 hypothetical protein [Anaerolineaceae bacterium]
MLHKKQATQRIKTIRWLARILGVLVVIFWILKILDPQSGDLQQVAPVDAFLLSLTGLALAGLLLAWRWELAGGIFTLVMLFIREIAWVILKGNWMIGFLILWVMIATPAILFVAAWRMERKEQQG